MITSVNIVNENLVVVKYDNREPMSITSDNGSAVHLMEGLLSPRWDMNYSQFLEVMEMEDDITEVVEAA